MKLVSEADGGASFLIQLCQAFQISLFAFCVCETKAKHESVLLRHEYE